MTARALLAAREASLLRLVRPLREDGAQLLIARRRCRRPSLALLFLGGGALALALFGLADVLLHGLGLNRGQRQQKPLAFGSPVAKLPWAFAGRRQPGQ